jgi:hydrogenase-4 component B
MSEPAFTLLIAGYTGGACASLAGRSGRPARLAAAAGAVAGSLGALFVAAQVLVRMQPARLEFPGLVSAAGGVLFRVDPLGAFFLFLIALVGVAAAIYGYAYTESYEAHVSIGAFGCWFNVFLLGMCLVPCAHNVFTFVLAWELMSLTSYFLVITEADAPGTIETGLWYIAMTQFSLVMILPMFFLIAPADGRMTFTEIRTAAAGLSPAVRNAAFLLGLVGFGSKAGLVPFHVWLPRAHPAAPSHVSALMSGVMIKLGIYGLVRVLFDLLGGGPPWWGAVLLMAGSASAFLGVLYALMERDVKRLLAYCSVENVGIIVVSIGAAALLGSYGLHAMAAVGVAAALFHTLNHACFKGLLFLAAGNVAHGAGTRNLEDLGGLIKRMPQTAVLFLIGSAAIAALPPLNGFASEWMVFQTLLAGTRIPRPEVAIGFPLAVGLLALASGLAGALFVKAFGIGFLAMPRTVNAEQAREAPIGMRVAAWLLADVCVLLGLGASVAVPIISRVVDSVGITAGEPRAIPAAGLWIAAPATLGSLSPFLVAVLLGVAIAAAVTAMRFMHLRPVRHADTWGCGRIAQTPRMEYTASAFAEPLGRVFAELYRPTQDLTVNTHPDSPYYVQSITFRSDVRPWFEQVLYTPVVRAIRATAVTVRRLQAGSVHLYLVYVAAALLAALAFVWWGS